MSRAKERDDRYRAWLDEILGHLRDDRRGDAAGVINEVPDAEVRDFAFFLALHVDRDLEVLKSEIREHTKEILARDTPSQN